MALGPTRRTFLGSLDPTKAADNLLRAGLEETAAAKEKLREALRAAGASARVPTIGGDGGANARRLLAPAPVAADGPQVQNPTCTVDFNANSGVNSIVGRAKIRLPIEQLAPMLDPRSWACSGSVIAGAFLVEDHDGEYVPRTDLDHMKLGELELPKNKPVLLWEYARSDVASFENILAISKFEVERKGRKHIRLDYYLYDCLICTFGILTASGGLTMNQGYSKATWGNDGWATVEVLKKVKVRDLTPNDPGNGFDFGESVNATIGTALSQWVNNISTMSPIV
jgi:hypothetical protein